jgi:predicted Zn-dependent protease
MFAHDTKEAQTGVIKMDNFEADLVSEFLHFVHTNEFRGLGCVARDLYELADYYDVENLKVS